MGISNTLEGSDLISFHQDRLFDFAQQRKDKKPNSNAVKDKNKTNCELLCFKGDESLANDAQKGLPFSLQDYFELIDWTGRVIRDDKKGAIPADVLPILRKLGVNEKE